MSTLLAAPGSRLTEARKHVQELHPGTATAPEILREDLLEGLKLRLQEASETGSLERFSKSLSPREIRALVKGLILWPDLQDPILIVLRHRHLPGLARFLWVAWQGYPLQAPLREILREKAEADEWDFLKSEGLINACRSWLLAEDPGRAIQEWLDPQGLSYSDLQNYPDLPLAKKTPLMGLVRDAVLCFGSAGQLRAEAAGDLQDWLTKMHPEKQAAFGQNYLRRLEIAEWNHGVLERLRMTFGLPSEPRIPSFWKGVDEERRNAFEKHFLKKELRKALPDEGRYSYWVKWVENDWVTKVRRGTAGSVPYAVLDFGAFGVIEFFEENHAAYFYPAKKLKSITAQRASHPSDLREQMYLYGRSNRLIHRGFAFEWGARADEMVRWWIRRYA